jgi:hypothetical protein
VLKTLDDHRAAMWFIALHVPYFGMLLFALGEEPAGPLRTLVAAFAVIHTGMHFFWPRTPLYTFDNFLSRLLIWSAGLLGLIYLIVIHITYAG